MLAYVGFIFHSILAFFSSTFSFLRIYLSLDKLVKWYVLNFERDIDTEGE